MQEIFFFMPLVTAHNDFISNIIGISLLVAIFRRQKEAKMKCNVGGTDMVTRLIVGVVLLLIGFLVPMNAVWQTVVLVLAAIALLTGLVHYCPINAMLKFDSCAHKKETPGGSSGA